MNFNDGYIFLIVIRRRVSILVMLLPGDCSFNDFAVNVRFESNDLTNDRNLEHDMALMVRVSPLYRWVFSSENTLVSCCVILRDASSVYLENTPSDFDSSSSLRSFSSSSTLL